MSETTRSKLHMLRELITCAHALSFWVFDTRLNLVDTTSPSAAELRGFFLMNLREFLDSHRDDRATTPVVFTNPLGLTWLLGFEDDAAGNPLYIHIMGPVFIENLSSGVIEQRLCRLRLSEALRRNFLELMGQIPLIPLTHLLEYGLMFHYCLRGEKISTSEFRYADYARQEGTSPELSREDYPRKNLHASWLEEQRMFQLVEEGNPDYRKVSSTMGQVTSANLLGSDDSLRSLKNMIIIHTALFTRSAMRGGVEPEIAYTLSDHYLRGIEGCQSLADLGAVDIAMQNDFVTRIRQHRSSSGISPQVLKCCDYIRLHLEEKLPMEELAQVVGYSATHLARKFKAEKGMSIKQYILACRLERAKQLLHHGNIPVQDICDQLGFGSQSYFGELFRRETGMTPMEYRVRKCKPPPAP